MGLDEYTFDKIEKYISGALPPNEAVDFEKEIAASDKLREAVDMTRFEIEAREYLLEKNLRQQMDDWKRNPLPKDDLAKGNHGLSPWWVGLLAIVVVAGLFYFFIPPIEETPHPLENEEAPKIDPSIPVAEEENRTIENANEEEVAKSDPFKKEKPQKHSPPKTTDYSYLLAYIETEAYQLPSDLAELRSEGQSTADNNAFARGINAFLSEEKNYALALRELESIDENDVSYERASEILPHVYFKIGQYDKAADLFKKMTESSLYKDDPQWYWLLSLMANYGKNKTTADELLEMIVREKGHNYRRAALALKNKIRLGK
jgi:pentatricopeptide repeat protein